MTRLDWLRVAHVLGAVLLLGNVVVTGIWSALLMRSRDVAPRTIGRAIIVTDWCFTVPGGALLATSGALMAWERALPWWDTPFLRIGWLALGGSTALWLLVLVPLQTRLVRVNDPATARRIFRWWSVIGWTATAPLLVGLWAMAGRYSPG